MKRFIRLRGLPWAVTNQEILDFLKGVHVVNGEKGIYLVTNKWDGKNTGEAFIELETEEDEEEAFKHNKEMLGHRYIEIFSASNEEAEHAMKKSGGAPSNVVKLRGLPYAITEEMIEDFFNGLQIKPDREGILIVMDRRGRASGEAYVQFETPDDTEQALKRNREKIGHRYIEIFRSSLSEMRRHSRNRPGPYDKKDRGGSRSGGRSDYGRGGRASKGSRFNGFGSSNGGNGGFNDFNNYSSRNSDVNGSFSNGNRNNNNGLSGNNFFNNRNSFSGNERTEDDLFCVHMRGLPYYCFETDVNKFFEPLRPAKINIIYNNSGLHSGSADAFFETHEEAQQAMKKHREQMGSRYIELFFDGKSKNSFNRRI